MAWSEVPAKFARYETIEYGGPVAAQRLLDKYQSTDLDDVLVDWRADFEDDLDYRLGACENLIKSRAIHPVKLGL